MDLLFKLENIHKTYKRLKRSSGFLGVLKDLYKSNYSYIKALDGIDFDIYKGDIIGYIGKNGAGKSTTIKIMLGIIQKDKGNIYYKGNKIIKFNKNFYYNVAAVFGQRNQLWWDISVLNSYLLLKDIYRISKKDFLYRIDEINEFIEIKQFFKTSLRELSLGQRMRCEIGAAFIHKPELIIFDEATIGIDIFTKEKIRNLINYENKKYNISFLITSNEISEIEKLAKKILLLDKGKILYNGDYISFFQDFSSENRKVVIDLKSQINKNFVNDFKSFEYKIKNDYSVEFKINKNKIDFLIKEIQKNYVIKDIIIYSDSLEDILKKIYN